MSDVMQNNRELSDEARRLENEGQFAQAAELYKQSYDLYPASFVTSHYITCLRKAGKSTVAVEFGRRLPKQTRDDKFVHTSLGWAIYDVYFKNTEHIEDDDSGVSRHEIQSNSGFSEIQRVANYVIDNCTIADDFHYTLLTQTLFAFAKIAKQRGKLQERYDIACKLNPEQLSDKPKELNGNKQPSDHQRWLYLMASSLLELKRYDECLDFASRGIDKYPNDKLFYWWQARAKVGLRKMEEALSDLERIDVRFPKEWYIQRDIADGYMQLEKYDEAWGWFCKAASSPGDTKGRYKMVEQMSALLERLGRWQEAYDHLQLAQTMAEREHWDRPAEVLRGQLIQFRKRHAEHIAFSDNTSTETLPNPYPRCKALWQETIRTSRPRLKGYIKKIDTEKEFGFIKSDNDDFHFRFRDMPRKVQLVEGMEVEFEVEKSYDQKKQRDSFKAVNIRPMKSFA